MDIQALLNRKYSELVTAYGDLCYKRHVLDRNIKQLEAQISELDAAAGRLNTKEASGEPKRTEAAPEAPKAE